MFPKKYFRNTKKEKLPRPFETASLLAPYLCLLYELLHVYFYLFRELRADGTFYVFTSFRFIPFFSGMPSLFQLANPFLPCRFSGGGNAELLQEYPATSPIIVSSVFFLKVNNPFYVRWDPFIYPLEFDSQPSTVGRIRALVCPTNLSVSPCGFSCRLNSRLSCRVRRFSASTTRFIIVIRVFVNGIVGHK
jgi:hypothetical protein